MSRPARRAIRAVATGAVCPSTGTGSVSTTGSCSVFSSGSASRDLRQPSLAFSASFGHCEPVGDGRVSWSSRGLVWPSACCGGTDRREEERCAAIPSSCDRRRAETLRHGLGACVRRPRRWPRARRDAPRAGSASLASGGDGRRTRRGWHPAGTASQGRGGRGGGTGSEGQGMGGERQGTGFASGGAGSRGQGNGSPGLRARTAPLASRSDARRARGRALALRSASLVRSKRVAPSTSGIARKREAYSRRREARVRDSRCSPPPVSACSRSSDSIARSGD
jgi:hypothetical protein